MGTTRTEIIYIYNSYSLIALDAAMWRFKYLRCTIIPNIHVKMLKVRYKEV